MAAPHRGNTGFGYLFHHRFNLPEAEPLSIGQAGKSVSGNSVQLQFSTEISIT
jgi:hypothetical protein